MIPQTPPPIFYCRQCGNDEYHIDTSGNGWGDKLKTICRACLIHLKLDKLLKTGETHEKQ